MDFVDAVPRSPCLLSTLHAMTLKDRVLAMTSQLEQSFKNIERLRKLIPSAGNCLVMKVRERRLCAVMSVCVVWKKRDINKY